MDSVAWTFTAILAGLILFPFLVLEYTEESVSSEFNSPIVERFISAEHDRRCKGEPDCQIHLLSIESPGGNTMKISSEYWNIDIVGDSVEHLGFRLDPGKCKVIESDSGPLGSIRTCKVERPKIFEVTSDG